MPQTSLTRPQVLVGYAKAGLAEKLGGMGDLDLPGPLYWQWRRWCTGRDFYFTDPALPEPNWPRDVPVDMIGITDDLICPAACVAELAPIYGDHARVHLLHPGDHGLGPVGHLAAFSRRNAALWPRMVPQL